MKVITIHIPEAYLEGLDYLVEAKIYPNRSESIRIAIRDLLKTELGFLNPSMELVKKNLELEAISNYF